MPARFSPRDWVHPVRAFYDPDVEGCWREPRDPDEAEAFLVAHYQSQVCREVTEVLRDRRMRIVDLAALLRVDPRSLRRKLNGEYPATIPDILRWAVALEHPEVVYAPGRTVDLLAGMPEVRWLVVDRPEV